MDKYQETFETWNKVAKNYDDKFMKLDLYNETYDAFLNLIPTPKASLIDIGCGPGHISKYLLSKNSELRLTGIDISENMISLAKQNVPNAHYEVMDIREIHNLNEKYDAIICGFCIPYLSKADVSKLITDCKNLLNNNGVLYLSFVPGQYSHSGFISGSMTNRVYFYYHLLNSIKKQLKDASFELQKSFQIKYPKADKTPENQYIIISKLV
ncbi:methyltransferase family protein [Winogradskyella epiphytica]|uniref:Methyltransferase family protein n=1 Tax=Winogradskyella epiphytica TaxID=262005 RepID=A0A2V4YBI6_9FLAO|nr:class I SAM-dependent methyltransferase [Winogradskyella epiphytica]PYE80437.1 methyltransferase family protein [Winogradskyella epiphytica]GGW69474.1 SAM-dependent methyltransferase [Winogradskyella epiphytica]